MCTRTTSLNSLLCNTRSSLLKTWWNWRPRDRTERQEEEAKSEELKGFMMQEMARGFYLRRHYETLRHRTSTDSGAWRLQQPFRMQPSATDGRAWCRLLPMGSQRVGYDWVTSLSLSLYVTLVMSNSLRPYELYSLPGSSVHGVLKNTGVDCHAILQGIFPTGHFLLYWQVNSLPLAPPGNPNLLSMKCYFLVNNAYWTYSLKGTIKVHTF